MSEEIAVTITGVEEARQALLEMARAFRYGYQLERGMETAVMLVERGARTKAPVDTGRLRSSITSEVEIGGGEIVGVVGSNVRYAPFQELGTRPHFVPAQYIGRWAQRHGLGYRSLFVTGRAHPFLIPAFEESQERIERIIGEAVGEIVEAAGE